MILDSKKINGILKDNASANLIDQLIKQQEDQNTAIKDAYKMINNSIIQLKEITNKQIISKENIQCF